MILAITERIENIKEKKPFNSRFYLTEYFKNIFDELNILLFPVVSENNLDKVCELCDGLIITGSSKDIPPKYYNEEAIEGKTYDIDEFRLDKKLINMFANKNKPILGICGGLQAINVAFGGSLYQNIPNHSLNELTHTIKIAKDSFLYKIYNKEVIDVNSFHHQAVKSIAPQFQVVAKSEDGIIEAIEKDNLVGVQWHPEQLNDINFFSTFINAFLLKDK